MYLLAAVMTGVASVGTAGGSAAAKPVRPSAAQEARAAVATHRVEAKAATSGESYTTRSVIVDPDGTRHVRLDRSYQGLSVLGGDIVVHSDRRGQIRGLSVGQDAPITLASTAPRVPAPHAARIALENVDGPRRGTSTPALFVDAREGTPVLAWRVVVDGVAPSGAPHRRTVVVDALTGDLRRAYDTDHTAEGTGHGLQNGTVPLSTTERADGSFELTDPQRGGTETLDAKNEWYPTRKTSAKLTDADNVWGSGERADHVTMGVDVHYGLQQSWDYFADVHGRRGIGGDGKGAQAMVAWGEQGENASWSDSCYCMKFGGGLDADRPWTSLDVVGHEMSHGVTATTADLEYAGESGGLNEATSDIFGTMVEFAANNPADPADYLVGEGIRATPLRYMDEPEKDGKSKGCWYPEVGALDVHYSSGIGNKFFYQLAVGSGKSSWGDSPTCGNAPPVTGIGNDKAAKIWFRALSVYMVSNTNYAGARAATLAAAADLYGTGAEQQAVAAAWAAVNVDGTDTVPPAPQAPSIMWTNYEDFQLTLNEPMAPVQLRAVDPQRQTVTFTVDTLPAGITMTPNGLLTGAPTESAGVGSTVTATDPDGNTDTETLYWSISDPPGWNEDASVDLQVPESMTVGVPAPVTVRVQAPNPTRMWANLHLGNQAAVTAVHAPGWIIEHQDTNRIRLRMDPAAPMSAHPEPITVTLVAPTARMIFLDAMTDLDGMGEDPHRGNNFVFKSIIVQAA